MESSPFLLFEYLVAPKSNRLHIQEHPAKENTWVATLKVHYYRTYERRSRLKYPSRRVRPPRIPGLPSLAICGSTKRLVQRAYDIREESFPLIPHDQIDYERGKRFLMGIVVKRMFMSAISHGFQITSIQATPYEGTIKNPQQGIIRCNKFELTVEYAKQKPYTPFGGYFDVMFKPEYYDSKGQAKLVKDMVSFSYLAMLNMMEQVGFAIEDPQIIALPDGRLKVRWDGDGGVMTCIGRICDKYKSVEWETFLNFNDGTKRRLKADSEIDEGITREELLKLKLRPVYL